MAKAIKEPPAGISTWLARKRLIITRIGVLLILVKLIFAGTKPVGILAEHLSTAQLGIILIIIGLGIRSWAAGMIHKNKVLTNTGPYALCRHPLYVGSLLLALGFALIINDLLLWIFLAAIIVLVYIPKIRQEETLLQRLFPADWPIFKREVSLLFPRKLRIKNLLHTWSGKSWWHHREYNAVLASLAGLVVLTLWSVY